MSISTLGQKSLQRLDTDFFYAGNDLGITYSKTATTFRVWAPLAERACLIIYQDGDIASTDPGVTYEMEKGPQGTWVKTLTRDLHGLFYTYRVTNNGQETEAPDPYAVAVGVNGDRSAVVDLAATNPPGWAEEARPPFSGRMTDAVIYELHLRDLSMHKTSGIIHKGKYLQFKEEGRKGPGGVTTGVDHLKELGVTHLHLLPTYDFTSINEKTLEKQEFNWGYDPKNYNVPEGSYATDPYDPVVRIWEYKEMIQALHRSGIRVIFDAVYNHTFHNYDSIFHRIVPGYYYRMAADGSFLDGSGCGNETASERRMMRKFMVDSVKYWVNEYHIDGFRFDLMGIHDVETMQEIREALTGIDQGIIIFGEGWDLGNLPREQRAIQPHAHKLPGIGFFNDHFRDNLKGPWDNDREHGFIDGRSHMELEVMQGVAGSIFYNPVVKDYNAQPGQALNYLANHDNQTLWDKLTVANPDLDEGKRKLQHKLGAAILLTAQGVPYLQAGMDFLRTKRGEHNSYRSPDYINALDWGRKLANVEVFNYVKGLIALRRRHPAFRLTSAELIRKSISFLPAPRNTVAYIIKDAPQGERWRNILVIYNANPQPVTVEIPEASWYTVLSGDEVRLEPTEKLELEQVTVDGVSSTILYTQDQVAADDLFSKAEIIKTRVNSSIFLTPSGQIPAETKVKLEGDTFYLPFKGLAAATGFRVATDTVDYLEVVNERARIGINRGHFQVEVNGQVKNGQGKIRIDDGHLIIGDDLAEEVLGVRILADFRRYREDGRREDYFQPDLYILNKAENV